MHSYYYYDGKTHQGPSSASTLKSLRQRFIITDDTPVCEAGKTEWRAYREIAFIIGNQAKAEVSIHLHQQKAQMATAMQNPTQVRNQRASLLLSACIFVFTGLAILQVLAGIMYCKSDVPMLGWSLILASAAHILPIAIAYALRQILERIVRG